MSLTWNFNKSEKIAILKFNFFCIYFEIPGLNDEVMKNDEEM
jgi:hypothetical protein